MFSRTTVHRTCLFVGVIFLLAACVQRKETLVIHLDGSVDIDVEYRANSERDLMDGDAPPAIDRGWFVSRSTEEKMDGETTYILTAEATFLPGEQLPDDYASVLDPYPETNLQFPTTVEFELRRDGEYCHVRRVYEARPWANLARPREQLEKEVKQVVDREFEELTVSERAMVLNAIARVELMKIESFARAAFDDIAPEAPQDRWLRMRDNIKHAIEAFDSTRLAELFSEDDVGFDESELTREQQKLEDAAIAAMHRALGDTTWFGAGTTASFMDRYTRHRRFYEITEDLGDEVFEITIEMSGEIIAHNADEVNGSRATWKFTGDFIRDRNHELLVTSRLPQ